MTGLDVSSEFNYTRVVLTPIQMAVVGNSYLYHTQLDLVENIEPGVAQVSIGLSIQPDRNSSLVR